MLSPIKSPTPLHCFSRNANAQPGSPSREVSSWFLLFFLETRHRRRRHLSLVFALAVNFTTALLQAPPHKLEYVDVDRTLAPDRSHRPIASACLLSVLCSYCFDVSKILVQLMTFNMCFGDRDEWWQSNTVARHVCKAAPLSLLYGRSLSTWLRRKWTW